jgi:hypothetical protein
VTSTFAFFTWRTFRNRIVYRLTRLKEIRYLLGTILGAAYFGFILTRNSPGRGFARMNEDILSVFGLFALILPWILPQLSSLAFSEAELHFVIGGPVSRTRILFYKLIQAQPQVLVAVLVAAFLRFPNGLYIGFWVAYCLATMYTTFVAVVRQWLNDRGISSFVISLIAILALGGAGWAAVLYGRADPVPWDDPKIRAALFVPRILAALIAAKTPLDLAMAIGPALLLFAVLFFVSATIPIHFNDLVMTASERVTRFRASMQQQPGTSVSFRRLTAPFRLKEGGPPEMAIVWKNTIAIMRVAFSGVLLVFVLSAMFLAGALLFPFPELKAMCAGFAIGTAVVFPLVGSMIFKQDYRLDVTRADVMKTWPIPGERLIAAEIAAPLATIAVLEIVLILNAIVTALIAGERVRRFVSAEAMVIALLFAVPIVAMQLCLRNSMAVLFPGWGFRSREEQRGFVAMGQQLLMGIINLVTLALFLFPAFVVSVAGLWIAAQFGASSPAILAAVTMPAVLVLCGEVWLVIKLLGSQIDKLDLGTDLEPAAI